MRHLCCDKSTIKIRCGASPQIFLPFYHPLFSCMLICSVVSNSLRPYGLQPTRLLCPWGFSRQEYWSGLPRPPPGDLPNPGFPHCRRILYCLSQNTGIGSLSLLQGIFPTQELNQGVLHCKWILLPAELPVKPVSYL